MSAPPPGPASRTVFSQRLRLHYVDWGNPCAPLLILLHGGRDHCRNWDWVAQALREQWHIIAPDLRGHGDSAWSPDGNYTMPAYIYDLAQLIHQQARGPVHIVAHSLGAHIALRYAGVFPENVAKLVAIEGIGPMESGMAAREATPAAERIRTWIAGQRALAARQPRRYATVEEAFARMQAENQHLSPEQALHLTQHGVNQNEDGTFSWKFDNYIRARDFPSELTAAERASLWARITCPLLLVHGKESWASNPEADGRAALFPNARVVSFERAGHWVHHDRLDAFVDAAMRFLGPDQA
jgi:pimeloyl-ACP methyl ester carboxylesterase